jgi:hypothetical protein
MPCAQIVGHTTCKEIDSEMLDDEFFHMIDSSSWRPQIVSAACGANKYNAPMSGMSKSLLSAAMWPSARSTTCM